MKILVFGSMNIDFTYDVDHICKQGETLSSSDLHVYTGGKGLNQAIALAKAGGSVWQAGCIGRDGGVLIEALQQAGVDTSLIRITDDVRTGNAIIQRNVEGDNCILLYGGANRAITKEYVDLVLEHFTAGDFIILQNEINELAYIIDQAYAKGMTVVSNPSPMDETITELDLNKVTYLILNEIEASQILGCSEVKDPDHLILGLNHAYPQQKIVLTLGKSGSVYSDSIQEIHQPIYPVDVVDTTAAGDTFLGFFVAAVSQGEDIVKAMDLASKASSIAVGRSGAAPSIPYLAEVQSQK